MCIEKCCHRFNKMMMIYCTLYELHYIQLMCGGFKLNIR